ncbi:MAG: hypothetical protein C0467_06285 [Planctomycetaceae bacterium]|nr:hypothetical protein [Planctomycetaceae bacterium]
MRGRWLIGIAVVGLVALGSHGESPAEKPKSVPPKQPAEVKKLPPELDTLNIAARKMYAGARTLELSTIPVIIVVSGDDLVLRKGGKRTVVTVIPAEYHTLKSVAHSTLGLYTHLAFEPGRPLGDERMKTLKEYHSLMTAAVPAVEKFGFDAETLARQKRILARAIEFTAKVIEDGKVSWGDLSRFCRASRPDVLANAAAACKAQLLGTHRQVMEWKKDLTAEEWATLTVVIPGVQTARAENAAVQYFARMFGESVGEGRRVVYAESLWDEEKAMNLLGTLRLDGKLSVAVFGDPFRMYRDLLADVARTAIDDIVAAP